MCFIVRIIRKYALSARKAQDTEFRKTIAGKEFHSYAVLHIKEEA